MEVRRDSDGRTRGGMMAIHEEVPSARLSPAVVLVPTGTINKLERENSAPRSRREFLEGRWRRSPWQAAAARI